MGLGDVEEVVAFVDGDFVFGAFFVDEGYVESSTEWFLLVERWGFGQWEVGGGRCWTNSSPGFGGSTWPWERAVAVENGWYRVGCRAAVGIRNDWLLLANLGVDALRLL